MKAIVIALYDYTGVALQPWAKEGYRCIAFDRQHRANPRVERFPGGGSIAYRHWDADAPDAIAVVRQCIRHGERVAMLFGWPPCDDLAGSGAKHWAGKLAKDPDCQERAVARARLVAATGAELDCPYVIENPIGALARLWRPADLFFDPCDYGGYIPAGEAPHPLWPEYIPERDRYAKRTGYWFGGGFRMPARRPVEPIIVEFENGKRGSPQWAKLGGKSLKTKNIRSATPRGVTIGIYMANAKLSTDIV